MCICEYGNVVSGFLFRHDADSMAATNVDAAATDRETELPEKSINFAHRKKERKYS